MFVKVLSLFAVRSLLMPGLYNASRIGAGKAASARAWPAKRRRIASREFRAERKELAYTLQDNSHNGGSEKEFRV